MIAVEKIEDTARFEALKDEWNELLKNSASDCLFLTWEWLYTWWKHLSEDRRLHIITLRSDGELVAVAPLALRSRQWRRLLPFPALEFLGAGSAGSDYLDILIRRGRESHVLPVLGRFLADGEFMLDLSRVSRNTAQAHALALELGQQGWISTRSSTDVCPLIDLSGHDWESYLSSLGPAHRYNVRRRLRNLTKRWRVRFEQVQSESQRSEALQQLIALHCRRWREGGNSDAFHTSTLVAFHEELSRLALEQGWLRLYVLRLDGEPAAALYGFQYHGTFYFYQSGFNLGFRQHSVGLITMGLAIKRAIEEGAKTYDFLRGDEPYKSLWTCEERELVRLELYPPGERGAIYRQTMQLRWGIRKMVLQCLPGELKYGLGQIGTRETTTGCQQDI